MPDRTPSAATEGASAFPPEKLAHISVEVREWLATRSAADLEALSSLTPGDVSAWRSFQSSEARSRRVDVGSNEQLRQLTAWWSKVMSGIVVGGILATATTFFVLRDRVLQLEAKSVSAEGWRTTHLDFHRDRQAEGIKVASDMGTRIAAVETQLPQIGQLNYRVGQAEEGVRSVSVRIDASIGRLSDALSSISKELSAMAAEVRVLRAGMDRIERRYGVDYSPPGSRGDGGQAK